MLPGIVRQDGIRKTTQVQFGGYDRRNEAWDGTFSDTRKLNPDRAPLVGSRDPFTYQANGTDYVFGIDALMEIRYDGEIWYNGWKLYQFEGQQPRQAVRFGTSWIIYPDKVILKIKGELKGRVASAAALADITNPQEGDTWAVGDSSEDNPYLYTYTGGSWVQGERVMQELEHSVTLTVGTAVFEDGTYNGAPAEMNTLRNTTADADWSGFKPGDAVEISGCTTQPLNNQTLTIREIDGTYLRFYENSFHSEAVQAVTLEEALPKEEEYGGQNYDIRYKAQGIAGSNKYFLLPFDADAGDVLMYSPQDAQLYLFWGGVGEYRRKRVVDLYASIAPAYTGQEPVEITFVQQEDQWSHSFGEAGTVTVAKKLPDMDFVFGDSNRLWGCKGSMIYASALGDPSVFYRFDGLSDDSWSVEVFSPGEFTGAISYDGYPVFFKEKIRYKVFGSQPSAYQLSETSCDGVKEGCSGSLAIVGQTLLYLSPRGVMADTGAMPSCISRPLGPFMSFGPGACAGALGMRYVISMEAGGYWKTFLYDLEQGFWLLDEYRRYTCLANVGGVLYGVWYYQNEGGRLMRFDGQGGQGWTAEEIVASLLETNDYYMNNPNRKRIHRVQLRLMVGQGSAVSVKVQYDSEGTWRTVKTLGEGSKQSYYLPVRLRRCDHFRLRFEGVGDWAMFSMTLETVGGSAIH